MINAQIAQIFDEIAAMLEILGENVFRVRAYQRASQVIQSFGMDMKQLHEEEDASIEKIPGIGKDLHAKIIEIVETGRCEMHEQLQKKLGPGLLDILRIRGIGPKKVKLFYEQLEIDNVEKLKSAAESGALAGLPGMGEKSEQKILDAIQRGSIGKERIDYDVALREAEAFLKHMRECEAVSQIAYAGSLRRKRATIGDIDLLACGEGGAGAAEAGTDENSVAAQISAHFLKYPKIQEVLGSGDTKSSVLLEGNVQVDLRVVSPDSFGAALFYFTGPKHFNIYVRTLALRRGLKINEYGIYRGEEKLAGATEEAMFEALEMGFVEPERREDYN